MRVIGLTDFAISLISRACGVRSFLTAVISHLAFVSGREQVEQIETARDTVPRLPPQAFWAAPG